MALIKCPECAKQISDKAKACPICGFPIVSNPIPSKTYVPPYDTSKGYLPNASYYTLNEGKPNESTNVPSTEILKHMAQKSNEASKQINKLIVSAVAILAIVILGVVITKHDSKMAVAEQRTSDLQPQMAEERAKKIERVKNFNSAKTLLEGKEYITGQNLSRINYDLLSVTPDMPEYKEAQGLLVKLTEISKARILVEEKKRIAAVAAQHEEEFANLSKAGKRNHAKHPTWRPIECEYGKNASRMDNGDIWVPKNQ
jgi:cell division protein FtsL